MKKDKLNIENEEADIKKEKKYKIIRFIINLSIILLIIASIIIVTIKFYPFFSELAKDEEKRNNFVSEIQSYGPASFFIIIGLQVFQTIFMIIPSGPIVMVAGILLNPFLAVLSCLIGQTLGGVIIYILTKLFGVGFVKIFVDPKKITESKIFKNEERTAVLMFGYLMIPTLPKDIVGLIAPFTKVKLLKFTLINFFARIPMTIVTVLLGSSLVNKQYALAITLACLSGLLALLCFIFNNKIVAFLERRKNKVEE